MDERAKVTVNGDVATRVIDDHTYIMNPETSELHGLNDIAGFIWRELARTSVISELADAVVKEYEVDASVALADTIEFIELLRDKGLVETAD